MAGHSWVSSCWFIILQNDLSAPTGAVEGMLGEIGGLMPVGAP
jgi:hypothetical protein